MKMAKDARGLRKIWNIESMRLAVRCVENGMSQRRASRLCKVPRTSLQSELNKRGYYRVSFVLFACHIVAIRPRLVSP